jgi:hypothetical protein
MVPVLLVEREELERKEFNYTGIRKTKNDITRNNTLSLFSLDFEINIDLNQTTFRNY